MLLGILEHDPGLAAGRPGQLLIGDKNYYGKDFEAALAGEGVNPAAPRKGRARQRRELFGNDSDVVAAGRIRDVSECVLRYQRTFMRPVLPGAPTP